MTQTLDNILDHISAQAFASELDLMRHLSALCADYDTLWPTIHDDAYHMVKALREKGPGVSVEAFLQEYGLSTKEGVAVMCLAEALLRIPDRATADALIDQTFDGTDWESHLGKSNSVFVNASSWGLLLTGKLINLEDHEKRGVGGWMSNLVHGSSEPVIRQALKAAMKLIASQFVLGETMKSSLKKAASFEKRGYLFSYDMLGEGARSTAQAETYFDAYMHAIASVAKHHKHRDNLYHAPSISIKLTALHPRYEWLKREQLTDELLPKLKQLVSTARDAGICVAIDAEETSRLDLELELYATLIQSDEFLSYDGIGFVLQAYHKRAIHVVDYLAHLAEKTDKRIPIRLVKGAYWDTEIKHAQVEGVPDYPVFTAKHHSDVSYLACAKQLLSRGDVFYPQFATHNAMTISAITHMARHIKNDHFEFQRLYGMGEALYEPIKDQHRCRIYAPIGEHKDLLAYLIRRLLENSANSSFVHAVMDDDVPIDSLIENPMMLTTTQGGAAAIAPPPTLYGKARKNSPGYDLGNRAQMHALRAMIDKAAHTITRPTETPIDQIDTLIQTAQHAFFRWDKTSAENRAACLDIMADLLEKERDKALYLLQNEAKKTLHDAINEWREAIDFCRYYAAQCRHYFATPHILDGPTGEHNQLSLHGRGTFVCISPWNFPLAIFLGQVTAALVAGNSVIAKPAEQTPTIAAFAVTLLHQSGIPEDAVQLACGDGTVGKALCDHPDIAGIAFTGSTATAKHIQRAQAEKDGPIIPFIAETGGQNAMVIDSSALLEQAVDDIIHSAFDSAGQRCSALRVCYVHQDIADDVCTLLSGAMARLQVGDPTDFATDVGPVIDETAQKNLESHVDWLEKNATLIASAPRPDDVSSDTYVIPHAYEIESITQLSQEHFGPILHFVRYDPKKIDDVISEINATGFGLTFGIHSRIPAFYNDVCSKVDAGNLYVNRSMTGAVVGTQPFGGQGLSGTGPKAGGPYTLLRYATERCISNNSAAIGGNIELLLT